MRPRTIVAIAVFGIVLYGYPGLMSYDSVNQLDQARRWDLGDQHPPAMAALWRLVEVLIAGPFGMLLLQATAFAFGIYLILASELERTRSAIVTAAICWFPPVLVVMGVIWKDSQMAGYLLLGIAALLSSKRKIRYAGLALLLVAGAMRHNAPAATLAPVVLLWASDQAVRWRRYAIAIATWVAITVASISITQLLVMRHEISAGAFQVADIMGTVRYAGPISDDELRKILEGTPLRVDHDIAAAFTSYIDQRGYTTYFEASLHPPLGIPTTDEERAAVSRAWWEIVSSYPGGFLRHHWSLFKRVINLRGRAVPPLTQELYYRFDPQLDERVQHRASPSAIQSVLFRAVKWIGGVWFAPFVYLVVALALLSIARSRVIFALLGSGIVYELALFPIALTPDFRYSHWLIVSTITAAVLVFVGRWRHGMRSHGDVADAIDRGSRV